MHRLVLAAAALVATVSTAAAQSATSGTTATPTQPSSTAQTGQSGIGLGSGTGATPGGPAILAPSGIPLAGCSADTLCGAFPATGTAGTSGALGSPAIGVRATPSLGSPAIPTFTAPPGLAIGGSFNQAGGALGSPAIGGSLNQAGALGSPAIGGSLNQAGGASASNPAIGNSSAARSGTQGSAAPSMSSGTFEAQCANSLSCSGVLGH